jgi:hypothetical protein
MRNLQRGQILDLRRLAQGAGWRVRASNTGWCPTTARVEDALVA